MFAVGMTIVSNGVIIGYIMKELAEIITKHLSNTVEIIASFVIAISLLKFLYRYIQNFFKHTDDGTANQNIRIQFGSSLTLTLELLLAADILATAIAPTWDDIGKLAAIAALRTALNYFLERELNTSDSNKKHQE
ncbi:MAG: DUF1622 domain-containing protein [Segetibacter sp.]